MGYIVYAFVLTVICVLAASAAPADKKNSVTKYTTKYDYIDVDSILRSKRLLKNYMECVLGRGPCTREGLELRKNIPEALDTECAKCSDRQKQMAGKVMAYLLQYEKDYWNQLLAKYDPKGTFRQKYEVEDFGEEDYGDDNENEK